MYVLTIMADESTHGDELCEYEGSKNELQLGVTRDYYQLIATNI